MKRHALLTPLSREHHTALVLAKRIAKLSPEEAHPAFCANVVEVFSRELEPHFREEEVEFLPRIAAHPEAVSRTLDDHARLRAFATQMARGSTEALREFGALLADHVRFEERELFPLIEATFPA